MIILASASPRRQELLRLITEDFKVVCSNADERQIEQQFKGSDIRDLPMHLARAKAVEVFDRNSSGEVVVIGADTAVICEGKVLGKPASRQEAREMLTFLSGKSHSVVTGVCVKSSRGEEVCLVLAEGIVYYKKTTTNPHASNNQAVVQSPL